MINIPKGTKDVLPAESYKWHYVEKLMRETAELFCLKEVRTPTFEHTELFLRGVGDTTDVVNKEMYTFNDKGNRSITLKPEGTAGVARAFIENGLASGVMPLKMYYEMNARKPADCVNTISSGLKFTEQRAPIPTPRLFP